MIAWLGLQVMPRAFDDHALAQSATETIPLPDGLTAPVRRFYQKVYRERLPVIHSVVITGRGR